MSSGEYTKKVSPQDIQLVQNLIERCLQLYMNQKEVIDTLSVEAKIEPSFTATVWQKLEEENREFFKAYRIRLMVKNQIDIFNQLLNRQKEAMCKMGLVGVPSLPISNGSHSSMHQAQFLVPEDSVALPRPDNNMHGSVVTSNMFLNGGPSVQGHMHAGRMDMHAPQNSRMGLVHGMNGVAIKSEPDFTDSSGFAFNGDVNVMGMPPPVVDMAIPSFGNVDTNSQSLNGSLLDSDASSSFGFLGQIPRSFSLSDLTAGFTQSSDILETYSRSPFLVGADVGEFLSSPGRECEGENRRMDTISEGLSYDEFCSD